MDMVERVARALRTDWEYASQEALRERARVIITAMREPTEAMLTAMPGDHEREVYLRDWQAMIDAALSESVAP
ncbi:MAG TPA: hypothetical protein VKB96_15470 [Gammaproteobacteria bacterium]|nr:hypothetical protein [Gammaproteobacteria bacterium]